MGQIKSLLLQQLETDLVLAENYWLQQEQSIEPPALADEAESWHLTTISGNKSFDDLPF